ncbi:MAG: DUF547 domain-containing protein [Chitinophagales bacterium]|nr:DUF547 domain-containing protein [Chitinophagales bacterium]
MKTMLIAILLSLNLNQVSASSLNSFFLNADKFFKTYVVDGQVDYASVKASPKLIDELVDAIGKADLNGISESKQKAFYINAYNILIIKAVSDHFPVKSPLDIEGIFNQKEHLVEGIPVTLSKLENEIIRPRYRDARTHFALVCAAQGCPPLLSRAYNESNVEDLLKEQTHRVVHSDTFVELAADGNSVSLSKLFEWYKEDYLVNGKADIIAFINIYRKDDLPKGLQINFKEYNWNLNSIE